MRPMMTRHGQIHQRFAGSGLAGESAGIRGEDRCMTRRQLDPSPSTTVEVFSRDLRPALTVDPGDTIVLR
jgi:hypothetical protein